MTKSIVLLNPILIDLLNVFLRPEILTGLEIFEVFPIGCVSSQTSYHSDFDWFIYRHAMAPRVFFFKFYKYDAVTVVLRVLHST